MRFSMGFVPDVTIDPVARHSSFPFLLTLGCLFLLNLFFFGGPSEVARYSASPVHREVATRLLEGKLSLPYAVGTGVLANDLEIHDGAWYTHWGYGVPLLLAPFQIAGPFPDRLIFFLFLCTVTVALFRGLGKWLPDPLTAGLATAAVLSFTLYWLISFRFSVYEQTVAYAALAQLAGLALYLHDPARPARLGVLAGLGILIRPLGLVSAGVWAMLSRKNAKAYWLALFPFIALWLIFNAAKTGNPFSTGFRNSLPFFTDHLAPVRFGETCGSALEKLAVLFRLLFVGAAVGPVRCGFRIEGNDLAPFLGPLSLLTVGAGTLHLFRRTRNRDLLIWIAGILGMLVAYAAAGVGFSDRYAADFAPLLVLGLALTLVHGQGEIRRLPRYAPAVLFSIVLLSTSLRTLRDYDRFVESLPAPVPLAPTETPVRLPVSLAGESQAGYRKGWSTNGEVDDVTEFFIGLPAAEKTHWRLRLSGAPHLAKAYINGRYYAPEDDAVSFQLDPSRMPSKNILVSLLWEKGVPSRLKRVEIE